MKVTLKAFANLGEALGRPEVEMDIPEGATLRALLEEAIRRHPGLRGMLFDEKGELRPAINVMLNGDQVEYGEGLDTPLSEGDEVAIFPPVAGG
ncbi:MAG: MoaD/ThiS family protein [Euryarchaeota archaeon]|nr:MoaD/ThiS family protein [Euryarchaeota archaeon]